MTENPDIRTQKIENPYLTDAMRVDGTGHRFIDVQINQRTLLGGFCKFRGSMSQNAAVARYKALCERGEISNLGAIDLAREAVDGGKFSADGVEASGADARAELAGIRKAMGTDDIKHMDFVINGNNGPTPYARYRMKGAKPGTNSIAKYTKEFRDIADRLALIMGLSGMRFSKAAIEYWAETEDAA